MKGNNGKCEDPTSRSSGSYAPISDVIGCNPETSDDCCYPGTDRDDCNWNPTGDYWREAFIEAGLTSLQLCDVTYFDAGCSRYSDWLSVDGMETEPRPFCKHWTQVWHYNCINNKAVE